MSNKPRLYIASTGMVTPVGGNTAMTAAAINAGISAYQASSFTTQSDDAITMARVPEEVIDTFQGEFDEGNCFNWRHDRVTKMAILALQQTCAQATTDQATTDQAVPLLLAMPERNSDDDGLSSLIDNLANNLSPWINAEISRSFYSGRASGMEAIAFAFDYLYDEKYPYILVGGSDSYEDDARLAPLEQAGRLLTAGAGDAFAPGEAASFLLLTPHIKMAAQRNGQVIALSAPGMADETGHLGSEEPYRGDGLDQAFKTAFKKALIHQTDHRIHSIYSSMNGENHWAKEYSVAYMRNQDAFTDPVRTEHPADAYGDLGAATATTLIALAAEHLHNTPNAHAHVVYSSSDTAKRGAIVVEKLNVA
jgi:3-oxoacyl-[acyl-carrier-protein] synthase-1